MSRSTAPPGLRSDRRAWALAWMLVGSLVHLACPPSVLASSSSAPSEVAKEKYERALRAFNARRYAEAVLLLEEVRRLYSSPSALLLLGHSYLRPDPSPQPQT